MALEPKLEAELDWEAATVEASKSTPFAGNWLVPRPGVSFWSLTPVDTRARFPPFSSICLMLSPPFLDPFPHALTAFPTTSSTFRPGKKRKKAAATSANRPKSTRNTPTLSSTRACLASCGTTATTPTWTPSSTSDRLNGACRNPRPISTSTGCSTRRSGIRQIRRLGRLWRRLRRRRRRLRFRPSDVLEGSDVLLGNEDL